MRGFTPSAAWRQELAQQEQRRGAHSSTASTFSDFAFQENVAEPEQAFTGSEQELRQR